MEDLTLTQDAATEESAEPVKKKSYKALIIWLVIAGVLVNLLAAIFVVLALGQLSGLPPGGSRHGRR